MSISPARVAAFDILLRIEHQDAYASDLLHSSQYVKMSPADHGLATELVMGALRWRSLLDGQIKRFSAKAIERLDIEVLTALRLGAYQLIFLERVPGRAAVHESVELVKRARKMSAAPFVNAVLRKLASSATDAIERAPLKAVPQRRSIQELETSATLDTTAGLKSPADQELSRHGPVSPSEQQGSSAAKLAQQFAHPLWLVTRWVQHFGPDQAQSICNYDQHPPDTAVRLSDPKLIAELIQQGIQLAPGRILTPARRIQSGSITRTREFAEGQVTIQDEGSQLVALLVGSGSRILDCCAAPGGKTRILAERNPQASIVALELHPHRTRLLRMLVAADHVQVINSDVRQFSASASFDCVLADVPCSGTGTLAHNPEIKWRLKPEDLQDLQGRQLSILRAAMQQVAPGGRLVYSTCSLEPEENEEVVSMALLAEPTFHLGAARVELERLHAEGELAWKNPDLLVSGAFLRTIPGLHPCDGFFVAILNKT